MANEIKVPELGENIDNGEVTKVLVKQGDSVSGDDPVVEMETGKATLEVPAGAAGTVKEIKVSEGDTVNVGQVIMTLDAGEAPGGEDKKDTGKEEEKPQRDTKEAEKKEKEHEAKKEAKRQDKAEAAKKKEEEEQAERKEEGEEEKQGKRKPEEEKRTEPAREEPRRKEGQGMPVAAAPSVRGFARELGVDIRDVSGSGPGERITVDDVKAYVRRRLAGEEGAVQAKSGAPPLPDFSKWGGVESQPLSKVRRLTARHMIASWSAIPHVTQHDEADITELEHARKELARKAEKRGVKLTVTSILLKICASALRAFPRFNASVDIANNQAVMKDYVHVGVAVDTPRGLLVPVIRDVDCKNILDLAEELADVSRRARDGKIGPDELEGGCFTLSNVGGIGGTYFTPIINYPECAILGVGRAAERQVMVDGSFQPRLMLPLSLSFDHRLVDGADGARFVHWVAEACMQPLLMALEGQSCGHDDAEGTS